MTKHNIAAIAAALLTATAVHSNASIVLNIYAERLQNSAGTTVPSGTMLQLIDLGADGIFNPINTGDGSTTAITQWVSGDDSVLDLSFGSSEFSSTRVFDLVEGGDNSVGQMNRVFDVTYAQNAKLGLRWFPGLNASTVQTNWNTFVLSGTQQYGQFTRQSGPQNFGDIWVTPADATPPYTFDALATTDIGGADNPSLAKSSLTVVPEPTSALLLGVALGAGTFIRRRKS